MAGDRYSEARHVKHLRGRTYEGVLYLFCVQISSNNLKYSHSNWNAGISYT